MNTIFNNINNVILKNQWISVNANISITYFSILNMETHTIGNFYIINLYKTLLNYISTVKFQHIKYKHIKHIKHIKF